LEERKGLMPNGSNIRHSPSLRSHLQSRPVDWRRRRGEGSRGNVQVSSQGEEINRTKFRRHKFADCVLYALL
jgi:hypothetical protein